MYSHKYVQALNEYANITCIDPEDFLRKRVITVAAMRQSRIVHIQYETSFFLVRHRDFYFNLCRCIRCPIVVTLHEVYDRFPGVFPRESLKAPYPLTPLKRLFYDLRHPYIAALTKHTKQGFFAQSLCVHSHYQKELLEKKNGRLPDISVLPLPVGPSSTAASFPWDGRSPLQLAATGFINDSFDFALLLATLEKCGPPWEFTWIGALRRPEDRPVMEKLESEIDRRGWSGRFRITGKVSEEKRDALLCAADVYCALFKYKSSSESLSLAIATRRRIVATSIPLTREMNAEFPLMVIAPSDPEEMAKAIERAATDKSLQASLDNAVTEYAQKYSSRRMAMRMNELYERVAHA
jgi:glycosyltransferase involved in cell wall biosynthesis